MLPIHISTDSKEKFEGRALQAKDLIQFDLQNLLSKHPDFPVFWVQYCTETSDVLGRLTLTHTDLFFEPLNTKFRGYINYKDRNLRNKELEELETKVPVSETGSSPDQDPCSSDPTAAPSSEPILPHPDPSNSLSMNIALSLCDVCIPDCLKATLSGEGREGTDSEVFIRVGVCNTGQEPYTHGRYKEMIKEMRSKKLSLAYIIFKIPSTSLLGSPVSLEAREALSRQILQSLHARVSLFPSIAPSTRYINTSIGYFDIDYFRLKELLSRQTAPILESEEKKEVSDSSRSLASSQSLSQKDIDSLQKEFDLQQADIEASKKETGIEHKQTLIMQEMELAAEENRLREHPGSANLQSQSVSNKDEKSTHSEADLDFEESEKLSGIFRSAFPNGLNIPKILMKEDSPKSSQKNKQRRKTLGDFKVSFLPDTGNSFGRNSFVKSSFSTTKVSLGESNLSKGRWEHSQSFCYGGSSRQNKIPTFLVDSSLKLGLNITIKNLDLLYILDRTMTTRKKFTSYEFFDENFDTIVGLYGLDRSAFPIKYATSEVDSKNRDTKLEKEIRNNWVCLNVEAAGGDSQKLNQFPSRVKAIKNRCMSYLNNSYFDVKEEEISGSDEKEHIQKGHLLGQESSSSLPDSTLTMEKIANTVPADDLPLSMKPRTTVMMYYPVSSMTETSTEGQLFPQSQFMTLDMLNLLSKQIPDYIVASGWELLYSRSLDGASYQRFSKKCFNKGELLLCIEDTSMEKNANKKNRIFGGYISQNLKHHEDFFGTGESFLFSERDVSF